MVELGYKHMFEANGEGTPSSLDAKSVWDLSSSFVSHLLVAA